MPVDEATTMKMHSKVRWGNTEEVEGLLKIAGTADCQVLQHHTIPRARAVSVCVSENVSAMGCGRDEEGRCPLSLLGAVLAVPCPWCPCIFSLRCLLPWISVLSVLLLVFRFVWSLSFSALDGCRCARLWT
jgi:hypothetical protein